MTPLSELRVLELGSTVAGPFCGRLLADFGAEVVKVEPLEGDPVRTMGGHYEGKSLYAASIFRNKHLIAIDLSRPEGQQVIRRMVSKFDIIIENFRPGTLEKWGLGYDDLSAINPQLIMVRISGFGQDGPYRSRPGYGFLGDAVSGFLNINGYPDRPPVRAAVPVTDMVTALYGAYGALLSLMVRAKTGRGQCIDAALYECAFSLMESHVTAYDQLGVSPGRSGSRLPGSTPNNLYETSECEFVAIVAASDSVFKRLASAIDQPELASDSRFSTARARRTHADDLDAIIASWTRQRAVTEVEQQLHRNDVPASRVYTMADIFKDMHYRMRGMISRLPDDDLGSIAMVSVVPKLSETPGDLRWPGRHVGENTREVLAALGKYTPSQIAELDASGAIGCGRSDGR